MAVAGYAVDDLEVETSNDKLVIRGKNCYTEEDEAKCHRGIARRSFERVFPIAGKFEVESVELENGLLTVVIKRELEKIETVESHPITVK